MVSQCAPIDLILRNSVFAYEFPLNESTRTWLRLEDLFAKCSYFMEAGGGAREHHAALLALFELFEISARPELKSDLLQELSRQRASLEVLRSNPQVNLPRLESVMAGLAAAIAGLQGMSGKIGQHIRENEWLAGIRSRSFIPGGSCSFDVPSYFYWLNRPEPERRVDLDDWLVPFAPVRDALTQLLMLLREGRQTVPLQASRGALQMPAPGRVVNLLGLRVADDLECVPEVSASRHAINIRFVTVDYQRRPRQCERDISFEVLV